MEVGAATGESPPDVRKLISSKLVSGGGSEGGDSRIKRTSQHQNAVKQTEFKKRRKQAAETLLGGAGMVAPMGVPTTPADAAAMGAAMAHGAFD